MSSPKSFIPDRLAHRFRPFRESDGPLANKVRQLLADQKHSWKRLAEGYDSLERVQTRGVDCGTYDVTLQFNPGRMVSTAANVDAAAIRARPCFLCLENLPDEQQGVLYGSEFVILCNPAPIFPNHYTVSHVEHIPQRFESAAEILFGLTRDLDSFSVFYNGPQCGASAPDHLHLQAAPRNAIPIEREVLRAARRIGRKAIGEVQLTTLKDLDREVIVLEGKNAAMMESALHRLVATMKSVMAAADEPMINVIGTFAEGSWRMILFPRARHRPAAYFLEGDQRIVVSPAAVDMGGLIVTPVEKDFLRLDASALRAIYSEVTIASSVTEEIMRQI